MATGRGRGTCAARRLVEPGDGVPDDDAEEHREQTGKAPQIHRSECGGKKGDGPGYQLLLVVGDRHARQSNADHGHHSARDHRRHQEANYVDTGEMDHGADQEVDDASDENARECKALVLAGPTLDREDSPDEREG